MTDIFVSTDVIPIQLNNLLICHEYLVTYKIHYAQNQYNANLDKYSFNFRAASSVKNAFVLLTKDTRISNLLLEVNVFDINQNNSLTYSNFIKCPDYNSCDPPIPTPTPTVTVTPSVTPTVTPSYIPPSQTPTPSITPTKTPTRTLTPTPTVTSTSLGSRQWSAVASSADGNSLVAVASFGNIYTSTNGGLSWTPRNNIDSWNSVSMSADGTKIVASTSLDNNDIYISSDSGITWTNKSISEGFGITDVYISKDGGYIMVAIENGRILISDDFGDNWSTMSISRAWTFVASDSDGSIILGGETTGNKIYNSINFGVNSSAIISLPDGSWQEATISDNGSKMAVVGINTNIYTSTDTGASWTARESTRYWTSIAGSSDGTKLVATHSGGQIYTSTDSGISWTARESNRSWTSIASNSDGTKLIASVMNGQVYISNDSGISWTQKNI